MIRNVKRKLSFVLGGFLLVVLSACGRTDMITDQSSGIWDRYLVYNFSRVIIWLSELFGGSYGMGIIVFTVIVRILLLPLMQYQYKSMRQMSELQPEIEKLKEKYPDNDRASRMALQEEQQALVAERGINQFAGCLPLLAQMPIMIALYQAISRTEALRQGSFLWLNLNAKDPYFILPILAAAFTFLTSWLSMKAQTQSNAMTKSLTYMMPVMIFVFAMSFPSAVALYWVVSNAFSVGQTLVLNNPYQILKEREEKRSKERQRQRAIRKAWSSQKKKRRHK